MDIVVAHRPTNVFYTKLADGTRWLIDTENVIRSWNDKQVDMSWLAVKNKAEARKLMNSLKRNYEVTNLEKFNKITAAKNKKKVTVHFVNKDGPHLVDLTGRIRDEDWERKPSRWKKVKTVGEANKLVTNLSAAYEISNLDELEDEIGLTRVQVRTNPKTQARYRHAKRLLTWLKETQKDYFTGTSLTDVPIQDITFHHKNFDSEDMRPENLTMALCSSHKSFHMGVNRRLCDAHRKKENVPKGREDLLKFFEGEVTKSPIGDIDLRKALDSISEEGAKSLIKQTKNFTREYNTKSEANMKITADSTPTNLLDYLGQSRRRKSKRVPPEDKDKDIHIDPHHFLKKTRYSIKKVGDTTYLVPDIISQEENKEENVPTIQPRGNGLRTYNKSMKTEKQKKFDDLVESDLEVSPDKIQDLNSEQRRELFDRVRRENRDKKISKTFVKGLEDMELGDELIVPH